MRSARHWIVCGVAGLSILSLTGAKVDAQTIKQGTAARVQSIEGVDTFNAYCAVCHGQQAKGNGPAATALKKVPADLTAVAKRHGGTFSALNVEQVILGEDVLTSHGSRDMPVWGPNLALAPGTDRPLSQRIEDVVWYLESIQEGPAGK
jgi:mono/diheme cytochrome c family protein